MVPSACSVAAVLVGSKTGPTQKIWLDKIEKRVSATASMLGAMKGIKMSGLTPNLSKVIGELREKEIDSSRAFRILLVKIVSLCKLLNSTKMFYYLTPFTAYTSTALTPVVAFGVYILLAKYEHYPLMDNGKVFSSLALMQLLLEPVAFLITALSGLMSAMGCYERIRIYLNSEDRDNIDNIDNIEQVDVIPSSETLLSRYNTNSKNDSDGLSFQLTTQEKRAICIVANSASCGWDKGKGPLLRNLDFQITRGQLTMIIGPVSSGKSTLLKALLRETPEAIGFSRQGFRDAAYCAQTPWLTNGTVKENIMGDSHYDPKWYGTVVGACALEADLAQLSLGDHTIIGSKGLLRSGGQQMRVGIIQGSHDFYVTDSILGSRKSNLF